MNITKIAIVGAISAMSVNPCFANERIVIDTDSTALVLYVGDRGRLHQSYFGRRLNNPADYANLPAGKEAYITNGINDVFEPALFVNHSDGNPSTLLTYVSHKVSDIEGGLQTEILLRDSVYDTTVRLFYNAYPQENILTSWTQITNGEKKPIDLERYASSMLHFNRDNYYLTQFNGDWASEGHTFDQPLHYGKKEIDSRRGTRVNEYVQPFFQLSLDEPSTEERGEVLVGTLAWTGNFRYCFDVDKDGALRVISGINPYGSRYTLAKGETFTTPEFIFTLSGNGKGAASRNLHDWARRYRVKDGMGDRMTLLNNWEATYFDFDQERLVGLIGEARELGVDMFLLDDGWFGPKYPRNDASQGLGDWREIPSKLPDGLGRLTDEAKKRGVKFGLWIEPEMVNPRSALYEAHPDWAIEYPNRESYYQRDQLVLDLSNPKVQDYVFGIVDTLLTRYPEIAYFKWDCNSFMTNAYSHHEKNQQQLFVDYVRGFYNVLDRIKAKYPDLPMMLCSGGGGRTDYKGLEYFTEFWPSDNTDPVERLFIQWAYSQVFPAKVQAAHVTTWNKDASIKFRVNVAMMGRLGFDINLHDLTDEESAYCQEAIKIYNSAIKPIVLDGDQYRLVAPYEGVGQPCGRYYEGRHTATEFVSKDRNKAILFAFDIYPRKSEKLRNIRLRGLDPQKTYSVREIDRITPPEGATNLYSGEYLMKVGLPIFSGDKLSSRVYSISTSM